MTRSDALRALLEKVEAGWFDATDTRAARFNDFWKLAEVALGDVRGIPALAWDAYNKHSLDAAKALHEAVLPEYGWDIDSGCSASVWVVGRVPGKSRRYSVKQEYSATDNYNPARAWIIAILKALIATEYN